MGSNSFRDGLEKAWEDYVKEESKRRYPNIMLIGVSGAGKSSLINTVFNRNVADINNVRPETRGYSNFYDGHDFGRKINLIDTAGYELNQSGKYDNSIIDAINYNYNGMPVNIIWYCISIGNERIGDVDIKVLETIFKLTPIHGRVCIVFTKSDLDDAFSSKEKAFKKVFLNNNLGEIRTFEVSSDPTLPLQIEELIDWSANQFETDDLRIAFIGSQLCNLDLKKKEAERIINNTCASVALIKVVDLIKHSTYSNELGIAQMKMLTEVFAVYGVDSLAGLTSRFTSTTSVARFGSWLVDSIASFIPIVEKYKDPINAAFTVALTKAIGTLASMVSYKYVEKIIKGETVYFEEYFNNPDNRDLFLKLFKQNLSK